MGVRWVFKRPRPPDRGRDLQHTVIHTSAKQLYLVLVQRQPPTQGNIKMSIALDAALYLREQKLPQPLTLTERGLLFTLLFRVGSNPFAWVSQETLAIETDTDLRSVNIRLGQIVSKGLIEIVKNPKDKRKNLYRPAVFLINYHQRRNRAQNKEYMTKRSCNSENTRSKDHVNTRSKDHLSNDAQKPKSLEYQGLPGFAQMPKGTKQNNKKSKEELICASGDARSRFDDFWFSYPRKRDKIRAQKVWDKNNLDLIADKLIEDVLNRTKNDAQWQTKTFIPHPSTYLRNELWGDEVDAQLAQIRRNLSPGDAAAVRFLAELTGQETIQ